MKKNCSFSFIIMIYLFAFIFASEQEINNSTQIPENQSQNNTNSSNNTDYSKVDDDLFKDFDLTNILHFDNSNYTTEIPKHDYIFILFYIPRCEDCKKFMHTYLDTAKYCIENNITVKFGKIDASETYGAARSLRLREFPSIVFLDKGATFIYNGIRTKEALINLVKRKMNDGILNVDKLEELKTITNIYNTSIIVLSTIKNTSSIIYKSFEEYAKKALFMDFVSCLSEECLKKYGEDIILFKPYDEKENSYTKDFGKLEDAQSDSLRNFTAIYAVETGSYLNGQDVNFLFEFKRDGLFYIRNNSIKEDTQYDTFFKELGKALRPLNVYSFVSPADTDDRVQKGTLNIFSIVKEELPGIFYYDINTGDENLNVKIYGIKNIDMKKIDINYIKQYIKDIKDGKIQRLLYSENPSESKYINGIKYVTGKTYDEDVINEKKNVLLGLIQGFEDNKKELGFIEVMENLTKKYQDDEEKNIRFRMINIIKNEPRDINVFGGDFPRAYLYTNAMDKKEVIRFTPKNASEPINFEELENFLFEKLKLGNKTNVIKEEIKKEKDNEGKQTDL